MPLPGASDAVSEVYIVIGASGEHSDHREWPVAAYTDKSKAEAHVEKASEAYRVVAQKFPDYNYAMYEDERKALNPYDPEMLCGYTGANYYIWEIEIREELPPWPQPKPITGE